MSPVLVGSATAALSQDRRDRAQHDGDVATQPPMRSVIEIQRHPLGIRTIAAPRHLPQTRDPRRTEKQVAKAEP
jgi:hypothetical protein